MADEDRSEDGPTTIDGSIEITARVLVDSRKPEPAVTRSYGDTSVARGVEIACPTSFAARKAAYVEAARERPPAKQGVLGGPLAPRGLELPEARVNARVIVDEPE